MADLLDRLGTIVGGGILLAIGIGFMAASEGSTGPVVVGLVLAFIGVVLVLVGVIAAGVAWGQRSRE